jgi:AraC-like DNA-binding protein
MVSKDGVIQPLEGLFLARASVPLKRVPSVVKPSFCVIAQGSKEVLVGTHRYRYDPSHYLIATLELPRISQILEASPEQPYLSFRLVLDPVLVSSVMVETAGKLPEDDGDTIAVDVSPLDVDLQDAVVRLVRLLDSPSESPVLIPLIAREIAYRLLMGKQGARLRHLAAPSGNSPLIARAVERLRQGFDQQLRIDDLASELGVSASSLHHHFKAVTAMSPLQFQKQLRLQEARRLMLGEDLDAASAAFQVGYRDASQFNREYKSFFGDPPMRDVQRLRGKTLENADPLRT